MYLNRVSIFKKHNGKKCYIFANITDCLGTFKLIKTQVQENWQPDK